MVWLAAPCILLSALLAGVPATPAVMQGSARDSRPVLGAEPAERAGELQRHVEDELAAADYAGALVPAAELLALRAEHQGTGWYETVDARLQLELLETLHTLPPASSAELLAADELSAAYSNAYRAGDFAGARELARQQLEVRSQILGRAHSRVADSMMAVAVFSKKLDDLAGAEPLYVDAIRIHRATLGAAHPALASDLLNYGALLKARGRYFEAVEVYREALAMNEALLGSEHRGVAWGLNNLAAVLYLLGQYEECERCHRRALALNRSLFESPHPYIAHSLNNLAEIRRIRGDYAEARGLYGEALELYRELHGAQHPAVATCLNNMAQMASATGDLEEAEARAREALATFRESLGPEHSLVATALYNLGSVLDLRGASGEAEEAFREALAIREELGESNTLIAESWSRLASQLQSSGDLAGAEEYYRRSLALREERMGADGPGSAAGARELAVFLWTAGEREDHDEVEELFEAALQTWRNIGDPQLHEVSTQFADFLRLERQEHARAISLYAEAIEEVQRLRPQVAGDELRRAEYASRLARLDPVGGLVRAHMASAADSPIAPPEVYAYVEGARGRALLDLLSRRGLDLFELAHARAEREGDPALVEQLLELRARQAATDRRLAEITGEVRSVLAEGASYRTEVRARLDTLDGERAEANAALRRIHGELYEMTRAEWSHRGLRPMGLEQVAQGLAPGEVLLTYDVGERECVLLVVRATVEGPELRLLELRWPDGASVRGAELRAAARSLLAEAGRDPGPAPHPARTPGELASALLPTSIREEVLGSRRVLLVPDDVLHGLPFEILPLGDDPARRWLDRGPAIVYGPSGTAFVSMRRSAEGRRREDSGEASAGPRLVAVCDPIFERDDMGGAQPVVASSTSPGLLSQAAFTRGGFDSLPPLPGTRVEVQAIADLMGGVKGGVVVLAGEEARLSRLEESVRSPRFLHLATHGIVHAGPRVYESALALTVPETLSSRDTGFLSLAELLSGWGGRLEGTELVTLSACRTAQGSLQSGEGFVGLSWGFLLAGADSVLASLWDVDDTATALFMARFYSGVLGAHEERRTCGARSYGAGEPMPKAEALQEAKRWLRGLTRVDAEREAARLFESQDAGGAAPLRLPPGADGLQRPFAAPYFWGAFVLLGDGA